MPYRGYPDGLYFAVQPTSRKRVRHYGIVDIGNRCRIQGVDGAGPMVLHQSPPAIRIDRLRDTGGWFLLCKIEDESAAISRINAALHDPSYKLFWHNCEHFARFVAFNVRESKQLQAAGWVVGFTALTIASFNDEAPRSRPRHKPRRRQLRRAA
jgi:hypothetical protein